MRRPLLALAVVVLLAAGCGDDDDTTATGTTSSAAGDTTTTPSSTTEPETSTTSAGGDELPGERIEIFPYEGAALAVVGVGADDVLHVRSAPEPTASSQQTLAPLADDITATGHNRQLGDGAIWAEVETSEDRGWVNTAYVAHLGATDDATARLYPQTADRPVADTLEQLAQQVAGDAAGDDEPVPRIVIVDGPSVGDLGEVTVDVLGYPDDSVYGERLHLFAEEEGGESFRLRTIEATTLCRRGVDAEDRCV